MFTKKRIIIIVVVLFLLSILLSYKDFIKGVKEGYNASQNEEISK